MSWKNTAEQYGRAAKILHWTIALLIFLQFPIIWRADGLPVGPDKLAAFAWHKQIGMTVFFLAWLRIAWRAASPAPLPPAGTSAFDRIASHSVHGLLYVVMLAMPLTGWTLSSAHHFPVSYFGLFTLPDLVAPNHDLAETLEDAHGFLGDALLALLAAHIGAALYHHIVRKDNVLRRMLPFSRLK